MIGREEEIRRFELKFPIHLEVNKSTSKLSNNVPYIFSVQHFIFENPEKAKQKNGPRQIPV